MAGEELTRKKRDIKLLDTGYSTSEQTEIIVKKGVAANVSGRLREKGHRGGGDRRLRRRYGFGRRNYSPGERAFR